MKRIPIILACALLCSASTAAQNLHQETPQARVNSQSLTIIIENQRLHFAASASTQEVRLEVFNQAGELVYDSGVFTGSELFWNLHNASGEAIPSGLYAYTLTIKDVNSEAPATRRGHLILESGSDRLWVTSQGAVGAEESLNGGELTVSSGPETTVAGARMGERASSKARHATNGFDIFDTPTPGRIPKFGGLLLTNSVISEDAQGRIGIGTTTPGSKLTVAGTIETTSGGIKFPNGSAQTSAGLSQVSRNTTLSGNGTEGSPLGVNIPELNLLGAVAHDTTLAGGGTTASPLGIANGGLTGAKIAPGHVVKSLNGMFDNVNLSAGSNITITQSGDGLSIAAPNLLAAVASNGTLTGNGSGAAPLGVAVPLSLSGSGTPTLSIDNNSSLGMLARGGTGCGGGLSLNNGCAAVNATGGSGFSRPFENGIGGTGMFAFGGGSDGPGTGGIGVSARGGGGGRGGVGVLAEGSDGLGFGGAGLVAIAGAGPLGNGLAGSFSGNVHIEGTLSKSAGSFKIDHPLDPANKYLSHSFVEAPDMKNIYDGNVTTDQNGEAIVTLPDYFEALNRDFRYQLTVIGQFAQAIVASKISGNSFTIRTDRPGVEVSWQVTGVRQDAYANKHRIPVEEEKPERERGYYQHPELFNQPEEKSVEWARNPELMREIKSRRQEAEMRRQGRENDR